ncbi:MAG: ATP-binding protein [bacterium]
MRISIFAKLALTFLVTVASLVAFLAWSAVRELDKDFSSLVLERETRMERGIGLEVDLLLNGLESQLQGMADNFDLRRRLVDRLAQPGNDAEIIDRIEELRNIAHLDFLWLVAPDGTLLASGHDPDSFGYSLLDPGGTYTEHIKEAIDGETVRAVGVESIGAHSIFVAEVVLPVTMTDRFLEREQVIGILWGAKNIDKDFMARAADLAGAELVAVAHDISPLVSWGESGQAVDLSLLDALVQGQNEIVLRNQTYGLATVPFPGSETENPDSSVKLHLLIPKSDLLERKQVMLKGLLIEVVFGAIVAILLAFLIAKSITFPIERLKTAVSSLASGDLSRRVEVHSRDEVEDLVKAFNIMADDLEANTRRLVEAEKLSAWREVARRLAHEIKNPLSPIKLSVQNLVRVYGRNRDGFEKTLNETSETILEEVDRLKTLADEFSNFARMPKPLLAPTDLAEVLKGVTGLFATPGDKIGVELKIQNDLPALMLDRDAMSRALINLLKNAKESMREGEGKIVVEAKSRNLSGMRWVRIRVIDQGVGMDRDALKQSFNPYFTTKRDGSGLGLAIVQSIISEHGGRIRIESEPGKGTIATIELPVKST